MGLEIIAYENILTLLALISQNKREQIIKTPYFSIHLIAEDEHINLNIQNYIEASSSAEELENYMRGFHAGLKFWKYFWTDVYDGARQ